MNLSGPNYCRHRRPCHNRPLPRSGRCHLVRWRLSHYQLRYAVAMGPNLQVLQHQTRLPAVNPHLRGRLRFVRCSAVVGFLHHRSSYRWSWLGLNLFRHHRNHHPDHSTPQATDLHGASGHDLWRIERRWSVAGCVEISLCSSIEPRLM